MAFMRRYRPLPAVVFAIVVSALIGGMLGKSAFAVDDKRHGLGNGTRQLEGLADNARTRHLLDGDAFVIGANTEK